MNTPKKICVVVGSRANYSSIKSAMKAINNHSDLELQVVATASAIIDRYGRVADHLKIDGFNVDEEVYMIVEGENPLTMAQSTGMGLMSLPPVFNRLMPDIVVTVGDRYETMATTIAASYMNIPVAHTMGGEVTGTIDESIRHATTKFAHVHFAASKDAAERIIKLGELPEMVFNVGCPRIDIVKEIIENENKFNSKDLFAEGVGDQNIDLNEPFLLVSQHPVTTEFGSGETQITETMKACRRTGLPTVVLWPNSDAGAEDISRGLRKWREQEIGKKMHYFKNLPIATYVMLMKKCICLIGNSSSGIREGAFLGTPVVNLGSRQDLRERGSNVVDTSHDSDEIYKAIKIQIEKKEFMHEPIYGDGNAGKKIANIIANLDKINVQKKITY